MRNSATQRASHIKDICWTMITSRWWSDVSSIINELRLGRSMHPVNGKSPKFRGVRLSVDISIVKLNTMWQTHELWTASLKKDPLKPIKCGVQQKYRILQKKPWHGHIIYNEIYADYTDSRNIYIGKSHHKDTRTHSRTHATSSIIKNSSDRPTQIMFLS